MATLDSALSLASKGFHILPVLVNGKLPLLKDFPNKASRDPEQIRSWFSDHNFNVGISTTRFGDDQALVVVDVDVRGDKHGERTILDLELAGFEFPVTFEQQTPSGGRHLVYTSPVPLKQGVQVLGSGVDIRSSGGFIVGPGSSIDGKFYSQINGHGTLAPCPSWLVDRLGVDRRDRTADRAPLSGVDLDRAKARSLTYLDIQPVAQEGHRNDTAFRVAAQLKDYGCDYDLNLELMATEWRCYPPLDAEELEAVVASAYKHGREAQGSSAPEAIFPPAPQPDPEDDAPAHKHPVAALNDEYAFVKQGAFVLHETTDEKGNYATQHMSLAEFHAWFSNQPFTVGTETKPLSKWWMTRADRRQYEGVVFSPQRDRGPRWFNLWRGFRVEPAPVASHPALDLFLEHARVNVCGNDPELFKYLMGYFAHLIQRPWEKPLVALVFKGGKGVGKNALVERVGALLGSHFLVADDDRYLLGNFNSHLESNLFFVLDEAAWAGDKRAEGKLKGLITGQQHNIERKGKEPYAIDNLTRVAIIGNEDWLVPASTDERRFAVFNVGDGRKQDRAFFENMRVGMEQGGYAHLLRYLLDFDLSTVDINDAPKTEALMEQKIRSLGPMAEWWFDCLSSGQIAGGDFAGVLPERVATNRLRDAYAKWARGRNIRTRLENEHSFGRGLTKVAPSISKKKRNKGKVEPGDTTNDYALPTLDTLRSDFERLMEGAIQWPTE